MLNKHNKRQLDSLAAFELRLYENYVYKYVCKMALYLDY